MLKRGMKQCASSTALAIHRSRSFDFGAEPPALWMTSRCDGRVTRERESSFLRQLEGHLIRATERPDGLSHLRYVILSEVEAAAGT